MSGMEAWLLGGTLGLVAAVLLGLLVDTLRWGIPPTPTARAVRSVCLSLMQARAGEEVADLGAGFGGMAHPMGRHLAGCRIWAIEASLWVYAVARLQALLRRTRNVRWLRADLMACDLRPCAGVFCYLYRGIMPELADKLRQELPRGAWVISAAFALPGWKPLQVVVARDAFRTPVYLYRQD